MLVDYRDKAVLVTGGTKGIGLATALSFARRGADVTITCKWGSVAEDTVRDTFRDAGCKPPRIVEADATNADDTRAVLERIAKSHGAPTAIVSNVAVAAVVRTIIDGPIEARWRTATSWPSSWVSVDDHRRPH